MKKGGPGHISAVITVYLSLSLLLVLGIICTVIESARVRVMDTRCAGIAYMAADSAFAAFARPVFDDYGVMMVWKDEKNFKEDVDDFICGNTEVSSVSALAFTDLYGLKSGGCSILGLTHPTDNGGEPFSDQVIEYMEYYLSQDVINRLSERNSIFSQGDKVKDFMDKIGEHEETFTDVEKSAERIKQKVDKAKKKGKDPYISLDKMADALEGYIQTGEESYLKQYKNAEKELEKTKSQIEGYLDDIDKETAKYYGYVGKAKEAVEELEDSLSAEADTFDAEIYGLVLEQIEDLREKSADTEADFYDVTANSGAAADIREKLGSLDYLFGAAAAVTEGENAEECLETVNHYRDAFATFSLDGLGIAFEKTAVEKEDRGFLKSGPRIVKNGLLGFIAGQVSEKKVNTDNFPSRKVSSSQKKDSPFEVRERVLFGEYILTHFSDKIREMEDTALEYEAEYILAGKKTDRDNLAAVTADMVAIRTGCNLISLLRDGEKKAETYALATSLVGFTGMPVVIKVTQLLIMAAWSLAESVADVKTMLEGGKVETIKDGADWYISIMALKNFGKERLAPSGRQKGLGYEDYLRLLLLTQSETTQCMRTMDMVQADICLRENEKFRITNCITASDINVSFEAPQLFVAFPFARSISGASYGTYAFEVPLHYSY